MELFFNIASGVGLIICIGSIIIGSCLQRSYRMKFYLIGRLILGEIPFLGAVICLAVLFIRILIMS